MLKPLLERLIQEYDFTVAKIDIDQNPQLANAHGVEGVPDVRICVRGEMQSGFVGVLPEPKLRELLAQLGLQSHLDVELSAIQTLRVAGDLEAAQLRMGQLIQHYPDRPKLMMAAAEFLIGIGSFESAEKLIQAVPASDREYSAQAQTLRELIQLKHITEQFVVETDLDQHYLQALQLTLKGDYPSALPLLLQILECDRKYQNEAARKAMVTIFGLLGNDHPLTKQYRQQLMLILY
jgi:putative thioredoxin